MACLLPRPPDRERARRLDADRRPGAADLHRKARRWLQIGGHCEPGDATLAGRGARGRRPRRPASPALRGRPGAGAPRPAPGALLRPRGAARTTSTSGTSRSHPPTREHAVSDESIDVRWWPVDALPDDDRRQRARAGAAAACAGVRRRRCPGRARRPRTTPSRKPWPARCAGSGRPAPRIRAVPGLDQVRELVQQHVVDDPRRHALQPVLTAGSSRRRSCTTPSGLLVVDPAHRGRLRRPSR